MESNSNTNESSSMMDLEVPSFTIEGFLLSALVDFPAIDEDTKEKKADTVNKYAAILRKEKLAGEKTLFELTTDTLREFGLPLGHVRAISKAAQSFGKKVESVIQKALKGVGTTTATNNTPPDIPLQERDDQLKKVVAIVENNLNKMSGQGPERTITGKAKTDSVIPAFVGGSGIGKTRLGYECAQYLFKSWKHLSPLQFQNVKTLYLMLDFSNGYSLGDRDENLSPSKILAIRLAHAYFVAEKRINLDFPSFYFFCFQDIEFFTMEAVLHAIRADLNLTMDVPLFVLLHIDEVQTIFSFEGRYKFLSGKGIFKDLIYEACRFFGSGSLTIQPFVSGTAHRKVMTSKEASMYTFEFIDTPLLSLGATFKLIEHYASQFVANPWEWKMHLPFLQLLGDMGGLPRAISYLLEECFGKDYSRGPEFFQKISSLSFYPIFTTVAKSVKEKYGLEGFILDHKAAALEVLGHSVQGVSIARDRVLGNTSVEEMELKGHIFLHQVGTTYYFRMPFLFLFIYNQYLLIIPDELAQVAFNQDNKVTWQGWESFNALFQVFLNNFLLYEKGRIDLTLGGFYHKADGHDDTKNLLVELDPLEVAPLVHRFPSKNQPVLRKDTGKEIDWKTCRYLLFNGKSAEFGDTVLIRAAESQSAQKYFGRKVDTVIVSGQQKWDYNGEDFTVEQAVKEHTKALETAKSAGIPDSCGLITVIFTTQRLPKDKIQSIPKDILIIHQDNFKDYYGPFATRAAFSIAHTFNPNFADIQHLQVLEGVGEETATEIAHERQKRPFKNLEDLCNRVKRVKKDKLTRELTFFPFTSKSLLLPFEGYK